MATRPSAASLSRINLFITKYCEKSGTTTHPDPGVTEAVALGLAGHLDTLGKPLCPCRFYPSKPDEITHRTWICACDDMQIYKYCHCLLFVNAEGLPITEYLPDGHDGRLSYGLVTDPTPDKGRPMRQKTEERERERRNRHS
ncbi:MAG: ferredoxin-thioredoxin reductase catalytic domain-containing protein [Vicinamibacterales bacterium]